jgi:signal transduction histidine kinase/ActR/RegA family two-component response regulator
MKVPTLGELKRAVAASADAQATKRTGKPGSGFVWPLALACGFLTFVTGSASYLVVSSRSAAEVVNRALEIDLKLFLAINLIGLALILMLAVISVNVMRRLAEKALASRSSTYAQSLEQVIHEPIQQSEVQNRVSEQRSSLDVFARALAHDLKEPVRTIRTLLDLVNAEVTFAGKTKGYFQSIQNAAERMNALIDTVYVYIRLDAAEQASREVCDANEAFEAAKDNIKLLIRERQAVITWQPLPTLCVNRMQMIQVFQQLLSNAIRHCTTAPQISIDVDEAADHWMFRVCDNGPGIAAEDSEKLFKPFKRLSHHKTQGSGLGLATCRKIIELHGGKIWHESNDDKGSTFVFSIPKVFLPVATVISAPSLVLEAAHEKPIQKLATVLLVDDNDIDLELTQMLLIERNRLRCNVILAQDGREALDRLRDTDIDLVLLDVNMPRMDGFELLERMGTEKLLDRVKVIMCSTSTYAEDTSKARELGACGYLTKPPEFARLKSIVESSTSLAILRDGETLLLTRAA